MKRPEPSPFRSSTSETLRSEDGAVAFTLSRVANGVFVARMQLWPGVGSVTHSIVFQDDSSFERWCNADPVRFQYPLVHVSLKRHGSTLLRHYE